MKKSYLIVTYNPYYMTKIPLLNKNEYSWKKVMIKLFFKM